MSQENGLKEVNGATLTSAIGAIVGASVGTIAAGPIAIGAGVLLAFWLWVYVFGRQAQTTRPKERDLIVYAA